jgi:predicted RNase H-like HicB family nuclease
MRYAIVYQDEEGNWIAEVPSLPGCVTQGDTREEVIANIREAIMLYLEDLDEEHQELYREYINPELVAIELIVE